MVLKDEPGIADLSAPKIARFSAAAAAIFTAPQKIAIFRGPKICDLLCEGNR